MQGPKRSAVLLLSTVNEALLPQVDKSLLSFCSAREENTKLSRRTRRGFNAVTLKAQRSTVGRGFLVGRTAGRWYIRLE